MIAHWMRSPSRWGLDRVKHHAWWRQALLQGGLWAQSFDLRLVYLQGHGSLGDHWDLGLQAVVHWELSQRLTLWSHRDDILLHWLDEDIIVEVNYVLLLILVVVHLHVDVEDLPRVLKELTVLSDDQVEGYLHSRLHLTDAINGAHDHLIDYSID